MKMESEIQKFYKGQVIFITGGTGFVGKQLIEKLLRVCLDVAKIYVLVRPKKNKSPGQRFKEIFDHSFFDLMKKSNPNYYKQLELIEGDCTKENLGIDEKYLNLLKEKVTICINNAANVNFVEPLRLAFTSNVFSTIQMVKIASEMKNLKILIHVSTAYSHPHRKRIDEVLYPTLINNSDIQSLLDTFEDDFIDAITPNILQQWQNTYCYTKALAEEVILEASTRIPCAIVRPAMVTSTYYEPVPGWIDNLYGPSGVLLGIFMGVIKTINLKVNNISHIVPCDFVANTIIAAVWENAGSLNNHLGSPKIYNYTGSDVQRLTWEIWGSYFWTLTWKYTFTCLVSFPNFSITTSPTVYKIRVFIWHTMMARVADFILKMCGKKPIAVKKYKFINKMLDLVTYFGIHDIEFSRKNTLALYKKMNEEDKKLFNFDIDHLKIDKYFHDAIRGGRLYLLKDPMDTLVYARCKLILFAIIHHLFLGLLTYFLYKLLMMIF